MDFVRSHFGKMKLWPVEVRVSFFLSDFLQNPYFSDKTKFTLWDDNTGTCLPHNYLVKKEGAKECKAMKSSYLLKPF